MIDDYDYVGSGVGIEKHGDGYNMQMVAIIHVNPLRPAPLS